MPRQTALHPWPVFASVLAAAMLGLAPAASPVAASGETPNPRPAAASPRPLGSAGCASCHPRQHEAWLSSQHRAAMRQAGPESLPEAFASPLPSGADYTLARDQDRWVARSAPGDRCSEATLRYTFGVHPLQQYLVECGDGRLQALPFAQDTRTPPAAGKPWFAVYGAAPIARGDRLHWSGRFQNANSRCIDCHATGFEKNYRRDRDGYASRWAESGVGCEACHGAGSAHAAEAVAAAQPAPAQPAAAAHADTTASAANAPHAASTAAPATIPGWTRDATQNTAHRSTPRTREERDAQVERCAVCHARREPLTNGPPGNAAFFDLYLPAVIDDRYEADGQDRDEVYNYGSFLQSRMHAQGVVCTDCHDPHRAGLRADGNALCAGCHDPGVFDTRGHHGHQPGSTGASCVECHMPRHTYMQIDERRDHGLRIPRPDLSVRYGVPNACTACHADRSAEWAEQSLRARGALATPRDDRFVDAMHAARRHSPDADEKLARVASSDTIPAIQRASAIAAIRDVSAAPAVDAIQRALSDPGPLARAWAARSLLAMPPSLRWRLAEPLLADPTRAVRIEIARALAPLQGSLSKPESRRRLDRVLAEYRESLLANEDQPEACVNLGLLEAYRGDLAAAEAAYRQALRIDPRSVLALVNLADLRRLQQNDDAAEDLLRQALAAAPDDAGTHHALGLLLQRRGRRAEAIAEVARAAELAPEVAGYAFAWALALRSAGQDDTARKVLDDALRRHPRDSAMLRLQGELRLPAGERTTPPPPGTGPAQPQPVPRP